MGVRCLAPRVCFLAVLALPLGMLASGCAWSTATQSIADVVAVASTDVWGDIAEQVGGGHVEVTSFISTAGQDPHSFESSARDVLAVSKADVVIENGGGYDDFMDRLLDAGDAHATVLNAVDVSGLGAGSGGTLNEHVWYDLPTAQKMASRIAEAFGRADPTHAGRYLSNAKTFTASIDALIGREHAIRKRLDGARVGVTEPVPHYLLEAIGAVDKTPPAFSAAVESGADVAVSVLDQTLRLYTDHLVAALVYNEQTSGPVTDQVKAAAQDAGIQVVVMTETLPDGMGYLSWMADNLNRLDTALSNP